MNCIQDCGNSCKHSIYRLKSLETRPLECPLYYRTETLLTMVSLNNVARAVLGCLTRNKSTHYEDVAQQLCGKLTSFLVNLECESAARRSTATPLH